MSKIFFLRRRRGLSGPLAAGILLALSCGDSWRCAAADEATTTANAGPPPASAGATAAPSPWMVAPIFSSNPKLGTSLGALAGYIHHFDPKSRPSIFAMQGQYSDTDSIVASAAARTSFDEDRQRLVAGLIYGYVKNDYDDYLGTGRPLKSNGEIKALFGRYLHRIKGNWFLGGQGIYQNFAINGESALDQDLLDELGVQPYKTGALGLVVYYDSRDNENSPTTGWMVNLNNMAYREALGGAQDFDGYRVDLRYYLKHGDGHVLAMRQQNVFTADAPAAARASVQLRGYKIGQYSADYMSSLDLEERWRLAQKWTLTVFGGGAWLYGDNTPADGETFYTTYGGGVQYLLKPAVGIVLNIEYAQGKGDNHGVYLKMGYAY